jgi:hypothetical protein
VLRSSLRRFFWLFQNALARLPPAGVASSAHGTGSCNLEASAMCFCCCGFMSSPQSLSFCKVLSRAGR